MYLKRTICIFVLGVCFGMSALADSYTCNAGMYLPAGSSSCVSCENGFYCPGGTFESDESNPVGLYSCPDGYNNSDANASSDVKCFKTYYCPALSLSDCDEHAANCSYATGTESGYEYYDGTITATCKKEFNSCVHGYNFVPAVVVPTLPSISINATSYQYRALPSGSATSNKDNDLSSGEWKELYNSGTVTGQLKGIASCSNVASNGNKDNIVAGSTNGRFCWCKPTYWTASGGMAEMLNGTWSYCYDHAGSTSCKNYCARYCAEDIQKSSKSVHSNVFNGIYSVDAYCELDTSITVYQCDAGTYLPASATGCVQCPANSVCSGGSFETSNSDQGISGCPSGYGNSIAGTSSSGNCYAIESEDCSVRNPYTLGHGSAVYQNANSSCKRYYGNQSTCVPDNPNACDYNSLSCDAGYHQTEDPLQCSSNVIDIDWHNLTGVIESNFCSYGGDVFVPSVPNRIGYVFGGWRVNNGG